MHNLKKPLYSVYPRMYCSGTIYVNDVPVIDWYGDETKEGGFGGDTMINQALLQSGKYKVTGKMYPRLGKNVLDEDDMMSIDFFCAELDNWKASRSVFHPKLESPWDGLSDNIKYLHFEIAGEIEVELPFVLDGWQNSVDLKDIKKEDLFNDVLKYYKQIRTVLQSHDAGKYLEMSQDKMKLQEQALYYTEERKKRFLESAGQLFSQNLEVEELHEADLQLEVMGYGKLVRLMRKDGSQPLQFKSPDIEKQSNIELEVKLHMRTKEKGFSII
ncbi:hypothetical protein LIV57_14305 [Chryseobacterium sp. X308]|uniref:hypothetical protein n=1 Tax=Chryseobacterium sp. X308 TaxID=2884873 RepID=UPI001D13A941|nr:hypothetical protein [Chryseobacterium sp. X308]MCC3216441.1 hypothetical protein [Chryseobacterium sp. X308]